MRRHKAKAYIGVTGFKTAEEFDQATDIACLQDLLAEHHFMFGFTCSNKRLADPSSEGKTSPSLKTLGKILGEEQYTPIFGVIPMIHYFTSDRDRLSDEIGMLFDYTGAQNLQLNAYWPDVEQIKRIRDRAPNILITIQLPKEALEENCIMVRERLRLYEGLIDYALIDPSGGTGSDIKLSLAARYLESIDQIPTITAGFAGGLGPDNVIPYVAKVKENMHCDYCGRDPVRSFCIDAQGKLRDENGLNMGLVENYLKNAVKAMSCAT